MAVVTSAAESNRGWVDTGYLASGSVIVFHILVMGVCFEPVLSRWLKAAGKVSYNGVEDDNKDRAWIVNATDPVSEVFPKLNGNGDISVSYTHLTLPTIYSV